MKFKALIIIGMIFGFILNVNAQDPPSGYTNNYRLRMWDEGAYPSADSINRNLVDIDSTMKKRDMRIDSMKTALTWMLNFPSGTWKRYDSNEFDNDTLKVKSGIFPKLGTANIFTGLNTFSGGEVKFSQDFGTSLNFYYDNDLGGVFFKKNGSTSLMEFDENDGMYWQMLYPLDVTGDINISGSYKINGVPISSGGGDVFLSLPNHFTTSNTFDDSIIAQTGQIENVTITDILKVNGDVITDLNFLKGDTTWIHTIDNNVLSFGANNDTALNVNTDNSVRFYESIDVDNSVNTLDLNMTGQLTNMGGNTTLSTLETYGAVNLNDVVNIAEKTTINADLEINGFSKIGQDATYVATKLVRGYISSAGAFVTMAHGLADYKKITGLQFTLLRDTTGTTDRILSLGYNASTPLSVGFVLSADTTNIRYYVSNTSTALIGDSVRVRITYEK